jgi:hypothetical protein
MIDSFAVMRPTAVAERRRSPWLNSSPPVPVRGTRHPGHPPRRKRLARAGKERGRFSERPLTQKRDALLRCISLPQTTRRLLHRVGDPAFQGIVVLATAQAHQQPVGERPLEALRMGQRAIELSLLDA